MYKLHVDVQTTIYILVESNNVLRHSVVHLLWGIPRGYQSNTIIW